MKDVPSIIAYNHIQPWLGGNLVHVDIDFNFKGLNVQDFIARLDTMLDRFENGDLKGYFFPFVFVFFKKNCIARCLRFFVFVTTHSDPATGFLHIAPLNCESMPVWEVFFFLFTIWGVSYFLAF